MAARLKQVKDGHEHWQLRRVGMDVDWSTGPPGGPCAGLEYALLAREQGLGLPIPPIMPGRIPDPPSPSSISLTRNASISSTLASSTQAGWWAWT